MSLLEDVFLQDEAGEAQELERIIEGDEYEERQRQSSDSDENSEKEDEAVEDKRRVDPATTKTKRVTKNPRFVLNPARLTGPRGISVIPDHFKNFIFKGKGHEKEDLDLVLKKLEHWAYRLYPKFKFEDCLKKIETLGKKRVVSVHLHKIRSDQLITEDTVVQKDSSDEEELAVPLPEEDEFDQLLQQQIDLARATPAHGDTRSALSTPASLNKRSSLNTIMPKVTSSPSISDEQREKMIRNRKLAEERRLARLKASSVSADGNTVFTVDLINGNVNKNVLPTVTDEGEDDVLNSNEMRAKKNRSNVIDSSDDEVETINEAVTIDIHETDKQNMIDLTEGVYHQIQNSIAGKENGDTETEMTGNQNNANETINLTEELEIPKSVHQKIIDLTHVQVQNNNVMNNVERMEVQNDHSEAISIYQPDNVSQNIIDLTEIKAQKTSIINNEDDKERAGAQNKRSDIVVSSDDDDDADKLVINEAVIVEVHKGNNDFSEKRHASNQSKKDSSAEIEENEVCDDHKEQSSIEDAVEAVNCEVGDKTKTSTYTNRSTEIENTTSNQKSETAIDDNLFDDSTTLTNKLHESNKKVGISNEVNNDKKQAESNHSNVDVLDDLMDVDFTEDF